MDYKNYFCPVCGEDFNENSDVVVCPDCGSPHHRACWLENGRCFNSESHGTGENLVEKYKNLTEEKPAAEEKKADEPKEEPQAEAKQIFNDPFLNINPAQAYLIDGNPSVYYEIAVKKNQKYYIPRFMAMSEKGTKIRSWNFWACLVPLAWSVYRKMYKIAAAVLAIYVMIFAVSGYFIYSNEGFIQASMECAEEDPFYYESILLYEAGEDITLTVKQQELLAEMGKIQIPSVVSVGTSVILIAIRVLLGLKADELYMKEITKTIKNGEARGLTGDKLKMFIFRKRGTLPIAISVLIGIFEWYTIY